MWVVRACVPSAARGNIPKHRASYKQRHSIRSKMTCHVMSCGILCADNRIMDIARSTNLTMLRVYKEYQKTNQDALNRAYDN
jgi:hypothetical protein